MSKRKLKKEVKKPDFFMQIIWRLYDWMRTNLKICIFGGLVLTILITLLLFYMSYLEKKRDELQYRLSEGANLFRQYMLNDDANALLRCEKIFSSIAKEKKGGISEIASLYLAKIKEKKGDKKEAERIITNIRDSSKSPVIKELAERVLESIH